MRPRPWLTIAILLTACSNDTPGQKLAKDIQPAASWVSTLQFTAEGWLGNRVPSSFVRETAKAADKAFDKARTSVDQSKAGAQLRDAAAGQLRVAVDASGELQAAIGRGDRVAVGRAQQRFAAAYAVLHEISDQQKR